MSSAPAWLAGVYTVAMADGTIELVVRDLRSGETEHQRFTTADEACSWLEERPAFIEVLGVTHRLASPVRERLQESMRPLDEEERREAEAYREREAEMAEARQQIERAVAQGFMLENRWPRGRRGD